MRNNNNSVSTLLYHIVWCTKYRHPVLTGAVEVETKTILAQTCTEYGWTLKAIEVMPEHVHLFLEASPDDAPSSIARTLKSISAVHIFTAFPKLKERKFWGSGLWSRGCYYGSVGAITEESVKKYIENQSMPFNTNVTFKFELHTENVRSCLILEKKAAAYYCPDCGHVIAFYKTK